MTSIDVGPNNRRVDYIATAGQTIFDYDFPIYEQIEIKVIQNGTTLELGIDYSVQDVGVEEGGTITLVSGTTLDDAIVVLGNTTIERSDQNFDQAGDFYASDINKQLNEGVIIDQELKTAIDRKAGLGDGSDYDGDLTIPEPEAGKSWVWNETEDGLENSEFSPNDIPQTTDDLEEGDINFYDKEVIINGGTGIKVESDYPEFTVTATGITTKDHSGLNKLIWSLAGHIMDTVLDMAKNAISNVTTLIFDTTYTPTGSEPVGTSYYDKDCDTMSTVLPNGVIGQWFEEEYIQGQNDTGSILDNGTVATYESSIGNSGNIRIEHTVAAAGEAPLMTIGVITQPIVNGGKGKVTIKGKVRGIQTDGLNYSETWADGQILYKSSTIAGGLTNSPPQAPIPAIPLAVVISAHATNGTLLVRPTFPTALTDLTDVNGTPTDVTGLIPVWDNIRKVFDFTANIEDYVPYVGATDDVDLGSHSLEADRITIRGENVVERISYPLSGLSANQQELNIIVSGANIYMETEAVGTGDIAYVFDEEKHILDCTTGAGVGGMAQVLLTAGTAIAPQINYVYVVPNGLGVATLTSSTSIPTGIFAWHSIVLLQDAATITSHGPLSLQRTTEALKHNGRGQQSYMREKLRWLGPKFVSGCTSTLDDGVALNLTVSAGVVFQLHRQNFPTLNVVTDGITVANSCGAGTLACFENIHDLDDITELEDGTPIGTNKYFSVTIWATMASSDQNGNQSKIFANLPTGFYLSESACIADSSNFDVRTADQDFNNTAFLVSRVTLKKTAAGNIPVGAGVYALTGQPVGSQGGGAGSTALTEFSDDAFHIYDNTDPTKIVDFEVDGVTTGTMRTMTIPDKDGTLALISDVNALVSLIALTQAEGNLNLSSVDWAADKANINTITSVSVSNNYKLELYPDDTFTGTPLLLGDNLSGTEVIRVEYIYEDTDATQEVHIKYTDNDGTDTVNLDIRGVKLN